MATPATGNRPTPERIFNTLNAYQQAAALKTAIEWTCSPRLEPARIPRRRSPAKTGAAEKGVRVLCDYLTIQGFLTKENGRYALTQESALFLDRKSPACLASMVGFLGGEELRDNFEFLTQAVRKGGSVWVRR